MELLGFFEWLESSWLGYLGQTYGGFYALVQAVHLSSMAVLGGTVLVTDLRLLGVILRDVPSSIIAENTQKVFNIALIVILLSGLFLVAGVAMKAYYNQAYWAKMSALLVGILFVYFIRKPLLNGDHSALRPWVLKTVALASLMIWFSVAATGRWIGFS